VTIRIRARHQSGFEVMVHVPGLEDVDLMVRDLQAKGYRPPGDGDGWQRTPEGLPLCPRHVLTQRERQGDRWHSHRVVHTVTGEEEHAFHPPSRPPLSRRRSDNSALTLGERIREYLSTSERPKHTWQIRKALHLEQNPHRKLSRLVQRGTATRLGPGLYAAAWDEDTRSASDSP
jgi:hypothetical protein